MRSNPPFEVSSAFLTSLFPKFVQLGLVEDEAFREQLDVRVEGVITLGQDRTAFSREGYFAAIRALHATGAEQTLIDETGVAWTLRREPERDRNLLSLTHDGGRHYVADPVGLKATPAEREADLDAALDEAGLARTALAPWRARLTEGPLEDRLVSELAADLANTPTAFAARLDAVTGSLAVEALVPTDRVYYERLGGPGVALDLDQLADGISDAHVAQLLSRDPLEGAKLALLLGTHNTILKGPLVDLPGETLQALVVWALAEGDLLSRLSMLEIGLASRSRVPGLDGALLALAQDLITLDPADRDGPLQLLSAMFALVEGQLSVRRTLVDLPPFQRRHLALAQAALITRTLGRGEATGSLVDWALSGRGMEFYLQTLIDMREEPRWQPEFAAARQLKNELLGRLLNAVGTMAEPPTEGPLFDLLLGPDPEALRQTLEFPAAFLAGPLEGRPSTLARPIPDALLDILETALEGERLQVKAIVAMINLNGMFHIAPEKIERAVQLIRDGGHRLPADADQAQVGGLLSGLADVAAMGRNRALAEELRIMARRRRLESPDLTKALRAEFEIALTAAAAHSDLAGWCAFVSDWLREIAFATRDKAHAAELAQRLELLCLKAPVLRPTLGSSISALRSFV